MKKWALFNRTIPNIFRNFIPHEYAECDDRYLLWLNKNIRLLIEEKNAAF